MTRIAVIGSYNLGLTMVVPRFPVPGETIIGEQFSEGPGGKGSNQAIAAARLDAHATMVTNVGTDRYGDDALALWAEEGVDTGYVTRDASTHTGVGFVIVDEDGENEITVAPGANHTLGRSHVGAGREQIARSDIVVAQLEIRDEPIREVTAIATDASVPLVLNPAPARSLPPAILERVTYLTPNQNEARILAGVDPDADDDDVEVGNALRDLGAETIVMTRGRDGAVIITEDDVVRVPAPTVKQVDTTGAGDAFNGALAVGLSEGMGSSNAVAFACCAGACAVTAHEVIPGLPSRAAVDELMDDHF